jgi:hypothetical protein
MTAMNRFAGFGDNGGVPFEKYVPAVARLAKPKNPTKPKSRLARNEPIDDEIGKPDEAKKGSNTMTDNIDRGPFIKCWIGKHWPTKRNSVGRMPLHSPRSTRTRLTERSLTGRDMIILRGSTMQYMAQNCP